MTDSTHPAHSPEFLSRLHDGELSSAEKKSFEAHLAGCAACGAAVEEFEASLAAFRTASPLPPASDLSARILRKIRAQSPSRRPFGVTFGIDLRWAGAAIAALLAVIIGVPFFLRREAPVRARPPEPISVHLADKEAERSETTRSEVGEPAKQAAKAAPAPPARQKAEVSQPGAAPPAAPPPAFGQSAAEEMAQKRAAATQLQARPAMAARDLDARALERAGTEAGAVAGIATDAAEAKVEAVRLTVRPLDGLGEAPALARAPSDAELAPLRGREFVLVVEADGSVREETSSQETAKRKDAAANAVAPGRLPAGFHELRFAPSDRPRRLLLRVD